MLSHEDVLIEKSGGSDDQPVGRVAFIEKEMTDNFNLVYSNFIHKIIVDKEKADPRFVFEYLRLIHNIKVTQVMQTQTNGIRNLIMGEYFRHPVLLPDILSKRRMMPLNLQMQRWRKFFWRAYYERENHQLHSRRINRGASCH